MSGSKTRFGFSGGSDPPDAEEMRAARTVFGHEVHLRLPAEVEPPRFPVAPTPEPPTPTAPPARSPPGHALPVPRDIEFADENTRRNRKRQGHGDSRLARFLGQWTKSGRFLSKSRMDADPRERLSVPRDTTGRNVLLVLLVALLTFAVTFAVAKLRQHRRVPSPAPTQPTTIAVPAHAPLPVPSQPPPAPAARPGPAPTTAAPTVPIPAAAKGLGVPAPAASAERPTRSGRTLAKPPDRLKTELLPLAR